MSEKKIFVPEGMLKAATNSRSLSDRLMIECAIREALRWLSENPIVPTKRQIYDMIDTYDATLGLHLEQHRIAEWQRRMFLAPEPEVPKAVLPLMFVKGGQSEANLEVEFVNKVIVEAYRRGLAKR